MKQTDNDKMDLLLRDLARREGSGAAPSSPFEGGGPGGRPATGGREQLPTEHLDADELNSYAEGMLPNVTRARYTAHLADCTRCRKLVTQLSLASGSSVAVTRIETPVARNLWERFGALFARPVWRYAIPALALFAVIAVTFIALKDQQESSFVAKNQSAPVPANVVESRESGAQAADSATPAAAVLGKQNESGREVATREDKKNKPAEKEVVAKGQVAANSVSLAEAKDLPTAKLKDAGTQPTFAPEPAPASAPKEHGKTADARRADEVRQQEQVADRETAAGARTENQMRPGAKAEQSTSAPQSQDATATRRVQPLSPAGRGAGVVGGLTSAGNEEVRTVAGRRFRRQGHAWIDTAYDPAHSAIAVARDSEQYRALIADEPAIRTIAEQLQGEVVVVWKNRTYRIR